MLLSPGSPRTEFFADRNISSRFTSAGRVNELIVYLGSDVYAQFVPVAGKHSRAAELDRTQRHLKRWDVLSPPLAELKHSSGAESLGAVTLKDAERDHILKTLKQTRWVVAGPNGAAARLGMKRSTLYFRMQKLGISRFSNDFVTA